MIFCCCEDALLNSFVSDLSRFTKRLKLIKEGHKNANASVNSDLTLNISNKNFAKF